MAYSSPRRSTLWCYSTSSLQPYSLSAQLVIQFGRNKFIYCLWDLSFSSKDSHSHCSSCIKLRLFCSPSIVRMSKLNMRSILPQSQKIKPKLRKWAILWQHRCWLIASDQFSPRVISIQTRSPHTSYLTKGKQKLVTSGVSQKCSLAGYSSSSSYSGLQGTNATSLASTETIRFIRKMQRPKTKKFNKRIKRRKLDGFWRTSKKRSPKEDSWRV